MEIKVLFQYSMNRKALLGKVIFDQKSERRLKQAIQLSGREMVRRKCESLEVRSRISM